MNFVNRLLKSFGAGRGYRAGRRARSRYWGRTRGMRARRAGWGWAGGGRRRAPQRGAMLSRLFWAGTALSVGRQLMARRANR
jgi:hypothetical protein